MARLEAAWLQHLAPRAENAPTVISTFAGGGGSTLGYSMAGFRELLAVEWKKDAADTFRLNFPGVPMHQGDIAELSVDECLRLTALTPGELDVLDGSPPCQGFSTSGNRKLNDPRNQLFREYLRLLRGLKPRALVMENVRGLVKGKMRVIFAEMLRELKATGYRVSVRIMNAMHHGVAQARERVIFIGVREDLGIDPSHPPAETRPISVREAIGYLPLNEMHGSHRWIDESPAGRGTKTWPKAKAARQGERYGGQHRRLRWEQPSGTLMTTGVVDRPYLRSNNCHPLATRTFSSVEFALLGSFPPAYQFLEGWSAYRIVGNSVPPLLMRSIARHLRQTIFDQRTA